MNKAVSKFTRRIFKYIAREISSYNDTDSVNQQLQLIIKNQYKILKNLNQLPKISETGFRTFAQFEEDGLLLYVLTISGFKTNKVVEMCCGRGSQCMATNLILNHGFSGYLYDGDKENVKNAIAYFNSKRDCYKFKPKIRQAWITKDNVNDLLREDGAVGEVDLLSLDIDGNDYWVWQAINVIKPRVFICETHDPIPKEYSYTIKYKEDFNYMAEEGLKREYRSVSLAAMVKLSKEKGYRMIGAHRYGFNVIFLRNDLCPDIFPEISVEEVHNNDSTKKRQELWPKIKDFDWQEV